MVASQPAGGGATCSPSISAPLSAACTSAFNVRRMENALLANPPVRLLSPSAAEDILRELDSFVCVV